MQNFYQKGMTLLEIVVVVSIFGILVSVVLPQLSRMKENQVIKNTTGDIVSALHNAQSQSLASVNSLEYGVHFQSDKVIVFKGETFSSGAQDNVVLNITSPSSISNVTLAGVSSTSGDIYFQHLSGAPSKIGTVTISTTSISKIITISATGAVSVN